MTLICQSLIFLYLVTAIVSGAASMMGHMGWAQERANENPAIFPVASTWAHPGASSYQLGLGSELPMSRL